MHLVIVMMNAALGLLLLTAVGLILFRIISVRRIPVFLLLFITLPVSHLFMLYSFSFDGWSVYWLVGLLSSLTAHILFLFYTISQEKKTAAEEELRDIRHRMALERSHYEAVTKRREELEKIRSGFNGKLAIVSEYVRSGEGFAARENLSALSESINRTRDSSYCAIPVINAVLTQKEKECEAAGIALTVHLQLPGRLAIEPMHLCSIFGNILDNAIAACQRLKAADKPFIRLSSITEGDYLFIKAANPAAKPSYPPMPGRGYGLRILSEIARQYNGSFQNKYSDGIFTVVMVLMAMDGNGR